MKRKMKLKLLIFNIKEYICKLGNDNCLVKENINNILGVRAYIGAEKPTNGEFIALVADKMLLEKM